MKTSSRGMLASALGIMCTVFVPAAQPQNPPATVPLTPVPNAMPAWELRASSSATNVIQFGDSQFFRQMQERLKDPQQRAQLRAENRAQLAESHRDLREALELDAATEEKVLELLTDQQMDRLDQLHRRHEDGVARTVQLGTQLSAEAESQTKHIQALRELVGQEKLERYQTFYKTLGERSRIAQIDARLAPAHKLNTEQKERLIALFQDDMARYIAQIRLDRQPFAPFGPTLTSLEEMQRQSQLLTIASTEKNWRRMPESRRLLRQRAAGILTPTQLATLQQMHEEEISSLQQWIQQARVQAGLSAEIPEETEVAQSSQAPLRMPIAGEIRFRIKLTVNRNEPERISHVGGNGVPVTFECAEGLLMEVTPTLYDDDTFNMDMAYYEVSSTGRRRIGQSGQMGMVEKVRPAAPGLEFSGSSGTILVGNKAYAIELSAVIESA